jgi:hypothetical protein
MRATERRRQAPTSRDSQSRRRRDRPAACSECRRNRTSDSQRDRNRPHGNAAPVAQARQRQRKNGSTCGAWALAMWQANAGFETRRPMMTMMMMTRMVKTRSAMQRRTMQRPAVGGRPGTWRQWDRRSASHWPFVSRAWQSARSIFGRILLFLNSPRHRLQSVPCKAALSA